MDELDFTLWDELSDKERTLFDMYASVSAPPDAEEPRTTDDFIDWWEDDLWRR
jgi:hypothetical protein